MTSLKQVDMLIGILANENVDQSIKWELACQKFGIPYNVINLTQHDWLKQVQSKEYSFFLSRPAGELEHFKTLYDERLYIIEIVLGLKVYPSYHEVFVYENKRFLSYFLEAKGINHPKTFVFYNKQEASDFVRNCSLPIVGKTNIGASGTGVKIIKTTAAAIKYIKQGFSKEGIRRQFGPNRVTGSPKKWAIKALKSPRYLILKLKQYFRVYKDGQTKYIILQEFIPHDFEWRVAKIGESYFAHKKIKFGDKASGSKGIDYVNPPLELLSFVRNICEENNYNFMAIDIFEDGQGGYLVNEMQTLFGHVQSFILQVDGAIGRYRYIDNTWIFQEGDFNTNESYDLRLETAIDLFNNSMPIERR